MSGESVTTLTTNSLLFGKENIHVEADGLRVNHSHYQLPTFYENKKIDTLVTRAFTCK